MTGENVGTYHIQETSTSLDVSGLAKGVYLLHLTGEDMNVLHRVVID